MRKLWEDLAWDVYADLPTRDRAYLKKLNMVIKDIERNGYANAEMLKDNLSGYYSRNVSKKDRIVFRIVGDTLEIYSVRGHYSDK
ncbi:type II toxin-antitoxin system YoeB family toxin [Lactovum odontotermitis]